MKLVSFLFNISNVTTSKAEKEAKYKFSVVSVGNYPKENAKVIEQTKTKQSYQCHGTEPD